MGDCQNHDVLGEDFVDDVVWKPVKQIAMDISVGRCRFQSRKSIRLLFDRLIDSRKRIEKIVAQSQLTLLVPSRSFRRIFVSLVEYSEFHEERPWAKSLRILSMDSRQSVARKPPRSTIAIRLAISAAQADSLSSSKLSGSRLSNNRRASEARSDSGSASTRSVISSEAFIGVPKAVYQLHLVHGSSMSFNSNDTDSRTIVEGVL